eukprot:TRINITY_DN4225_c0_g1_i1.p2 TRINITY_DN4225_c0_g1~~TRINITY_DN4225_c0_g1_i1.p2  ORF type:complete len:153 (+),score=46.80 TRINITY_DN4225_c0_g1_i1:111-569(+)
MADDAPAGGADYAAEDAGLQLERDVKEVIQNSLARNGLVRGLREVVKCLVRGNAQLVIMAKDCGEDAYKKLVTALCDQQKVYCVEVASREDLGQMVGLFKADAEGNPREVADASGATKKKIVKCSSVCITEFGAPSTALANLRAELQRGPSA